MIAGIAIGILIGLVTGTVALLLLKTAAGASITELTALLAITAELLSIPTFWFGGPWLTTTVFKLVPLEEIINPYIVTLALTYLVFILYPTFRWIVQLGNELGNNQENRNNAD